MAQPPLFFQGAELAMSSGIVNDTYAKVQRVTNISVGFQPPRTQQRVLGRMLPLNQQPVLNYIPVSLSVNDTLGNKDVARNLGLLNSTGILTQIGQNTEVTNWGARSFQIYNAPVNATNYAGQWNVVTGIVKSYSLAGSVGGVVDESFSIEALDLQQVANNTARTVPNYSGTVVKSENMVLTGINFTGLGFSGLTIQSFSFQTSINHAATFRIGTQFPERRITDGTATLQVVGFMEGVTNTLTSLNTYACGNALTGTVVLGLTPGCSNEPPLSITMVSPYLDSQTMGVQIGAYVEVTLGFSVPLTTVPAETSLGSNVTLT
jgi:hypothetical protein